MFRKDKKYDLVCHAHQMLEEPVLSFATLNLIDVEGSLITFLDKDHTMVAFNILKGECVIDAALEIKMKTLFDDTTDDESRYVNWAVTLFSSLRLLS
eukprot:m.33774 g.33774  ORF g.33774 m.33774 type:complete len:97 (-) comp6474_c0_seq1:3991-4281(-)